MNWRPILRWLRVKHNPMPLFLMMFFFSALFYKDRDIKICTMFTALSFMALVLYKCPCPKD